MEFIPGKLYRIRKSFEYPVFIDYNTINTVPIIKGDVLMYMNMICHNDVTVMVIFLYGSRFVYRRVSSKIEQFNEWASEYFEMA